MRTLPLIAKIALWLCAHACLLAALLALTGCGAIRGASGIVAQQTPGQSTGAGATFTGPANSAAASTQTAQRRVAYYPPPQREALPRYAPQSAQAESPEARAQSQTPTATAEPASSQLSTLNSQLLAPPPPAWIDEKIETTFGQHQDAAGLVKAATAIGSWGRARWLGILCILFAAFALAWAHNNPEGYPLVAWKIGAVGVFLALFDPSPWWLLLLIIPAAFYTIQKLKITLPT